MAMHRGHLIYQGRGGEYRYVDNDVMVRDDPVRTCGSCGCDNTTEGHDACLGTLPGVMNACCGHGDRDQSYIQFENGDIVRGFALDRPTVAEEAERDEAEEIWDYIEAD